MNQPCGIFLPACFLWKHPSVQILMHLMEESSQSSSHWLWSDMIWYKMLTRFKKMCQLQVHLRKNGSWFDIKNMSNSVVVLLPNILVIPALSCMLKYSSGVPGYQSRGLSGIWHGLPLSVSPVATWRRANLDGQTGGVCFALSSLGQKSGTRQDSPLITWWIQWDFVWVDRFSFLIFIFLQATMIMWIWCVRTPGMHCKDIVCADFSGCLNVLNRSTKIQKCSTWTAGWMNLMWW